MLNAPLSRMLTTLAWGLTTKKFAGSPAASALLRKVRLLSRSPAALLLRPLATVEVTVVELTKFGFGLVCTSRPASVALLHVAAPPVCAFGLSASRRPFR